MNKKKKNTEITEELRNITPRADLFSEESPYNPPEGYFQRLPESILSDLRNEEKSSLAKDLQNAEGGLPTKGTPPSAENASLAKDLQNANKNSLLMENRRAVQLPQSLPIEEISMSTIPLLFSKKMMRYGIAAVTIGLLALVGWWYFLSPRIENSHFFAGIDDNELIKEIQPLPKSEIIAYMESGAFPLPYGSLDTPSEIKDEDIRLMLADLTEAELQSYLEKEEAFN